MINQYVRYIYNISFGIAAITAFLSITYAGFLYLTSAGNPAKIKEAKDRIFSSLLGIGILLVSYVLLVVINPGLIVLTMPALQDTSLIALPNAPLQEPKSTFLATIKEIGVRGALTMDGIEDAARLISESMATSCFCINAKSLCLCSGGEENDKCEPQICYAGDTDGEPLNPGHPCSNYEEIKRNQELIMFLLDELVYYQNRAVGSEFVKNLSLDLDNVDIFDAINNPSLALADSVNLGGEAMRLQRDIDKILWPTLEYYNKFILTQTDQTVINLLLEEQAKKREEFELTKDLRNELMYFAWLVDPLKYLVAEIAKLPDQCALNTQTKCGPPKCIYQPEMSVPGRDEKLNACHNTYIGCRSICLKGLTPCPFIETALVYAGIDTLQGLIVDRAKNIIEIVDKIRDTRSQF